MQNIPIVTLMIVLSVILILRIIYKAWRNRQANANIRRRPSGKSSILHRAVPADGAAAPSPLQVPPVAPVAEAAPTLAATERVTRDTLVSIHDEPEAIRSSSDSKRSRVFGKSSIDSIDYVTAGSLAQQAKAAAEIEPVDGEIFGDGNDMVFGPLTTTLASMLPESDDRRRELTRTLQNAGYYERHAWHNLAAVRYLGIFLPIIVCGLLLAFGPPQLEPYLVGAIVLLPLAGWSLPTLMIRSKAATRLREISNGMPDMLDLLNMCVSQGMTVSKSLGRVGHDLDPVYPALAKELRIVTEQARVGSLQQALTGFSQRVDVPEVHSFTSLIIQTDRMGTSMSDALIDYSDSMRETMRQRADQKATSATFKLLFPTVLCLLPAVYLFLLGPAIIQLSDFYTGRGREVLQNGNAGGGSFTGQGAASGR